MPFTDYRSLCIVIWESQMSENIVTEIYLTPQFNNLPIAILSSLQKCEVNLRTRPVG